MACAAFKNVPQTLATTFAFSSVCFFYCTMGWREEKGEGGMSFSRVDWQGVGEGGGSDAG